MATNTTQGAILRARLASAADTQREVAAVMLINATALPDDDRFGRLVGRVDGRDTVVDWPGLLREPCAEDLSGGHQRMVWAAVTIHEGGEVDFDRARGPLDEENTQILRAAIELAASAKV